MIKYKIIRGEVMAIYESGEMYLENILILHEKSSFVRAIDICKKADCPYRQEQRPKYEKNKNEPKLFES